MSKKSKKQKSAIKKSNVDHKKSNNSRHKPAAKASLLNRRNALKFLIAVPVVGVASAAIHRYDVQNKERHDLSPIGQGLPVVVQVHDPSCPSCKRLMSNTKKALKDQDKIVYRIADLTTGKGAVFARKHKAGKVTLIMFDKNGKSVDRIEGVMDIADLTKRFAAL